MHSSSHPFTLPVYPLHMSFLTSLPSPIHPHPSPPFHCLLSTQPGPASAVCIIIGCCYIRSSTCSQQRLSLLCLSFHSPSTHWCPSGLPSTVRSRLLTCLLPWPWYQLVPGPHIVQVLLRSRLMFGLGGLLCCQLLPGGLWVADLMWFLDHPFANPMGTHALPHPKLPPDPSCVCVPLSPGGYPDSCCGGGAEGSVGTRPGSQ